MVHMSELHKVFKFVKKRSAMIENNLIEQNGPNRKKYAMKKRKINLNVIKLRDDEPSRYYCLDGIFI